MASEVERAKLRLVHPKLNPLLHSLPSWVVDFRAHQRVAIEQINDAFTRSDVVVLEAPTGSGKTLIAEIVRRMNSWNAVYVCTSKQLQDQFLNDYPYARLLKGRSNYATELFAKAYHPNDYTGHISCEDCTWSRESPSCRYCRRKDGCPYEVAKMSALRAELAVLNTSYLLAEANGPGKFSGNELVIADEADMLEEALMGHVSVEIGERRLKDLGWEPPEKVTVQSSWAEWLDVHIVKLRQRISRFPDVIDNIHQAREARSLVRLQSSLETVKSGLESGIWVYTGRGRKDEARKGVSFKPSRVDSLGNSYLWRHGKKWLLMSATVVSSDVMLDSLGYAGSFETVKVANTFPLENRRVHVRSVASVSYKTKNEAYPKIAAEVGLILKEHPDDRVLVHTVSYELTKALLVSIPESRPSFAYLYSQDKQTALDGYRATPGSVLLAPSMDRGVDLPGDLCRVQVIVKVPFLFLGDRQVSARLHSPGGQTWYNVNAMRTLMQMCGRGVRSETDWATTYILDSHFKSLFDKGRGMFPDWFREAIVWR